MAAVSAASIKLYDICQNIYEGHFLRYFFQASRNVLFDAMRKERRIAHRNARISRNAVDRTIHRQEAQHDLEIIFRKLKPSQQERILATYEGTRNEGHLRAYAKAKGLSVGAVKAGNHKMRKRVSRLFGAL